VAFNLLLISIFALVGSLMFTFRVQVSQGIWLTSMMGLFFFYNCSIYIASHPMRNMSNLEQSKLFNLLTMSWIAFVALLVITEGDAIEVATDLPAEGINSGKRRQR